MLLSCTYHAPQVYIYGCFSRYFSFVIDNAKPACLFFKNCINYFKSRKAHVWDNWSKQCTQEVLVMATELVSSTILFPTKKLFFETKISIHFIDICSRPYSAFFLNSIQVSFHVAVWQDWLMLHNFVSALACFTIFTSLPFDCRW